MRSTAHEAFTQLLSAALVCQCRIPFHIWVLIVSVLQAEDMAIEECFDLLASALNAGSVKLDVYVKSLRLLAEDQYRCRLLGIKIQERQHLQPRPPSAEAVQLPQGVAWRSTATYPSLGQS